MDLAEAEKAVEIATRDSAKAYNIELPYPKRHTMSRLDALAEVSQQHLNHPDTQTLGHINGEIAGAVQVTGNEQRDCAPGETSDFGLEDRRLLGTHENTGQLGQPAI